MELAWSRSTEWVLPTETLGCTVFSEKESVEMLMTGVCICW